VRNWPFLQLFLSVLLLLVAGLLLFSMTGTRKDTILLGWQEPTVESDSSEVNLYLEMKSTSAIFGLTISLGDKTLYKREDALADLEIEFTVSKQNESMDLLFTGRVDPMDRPFALHIEVEPDHLTSVARTFWVDRADFSIRLPWMEQVQENP